MKKVLSMVLTVVMLVSIFSTVINSGEVLAATNNQYLAILPKDNKPSTKPVTPIKTATPVATPTLQSVTPVTSSINPTVVPSSQLVYSSDFAFKIGTINASPNEFINVPLTLRNVPDNGIIVFDMTINYDPNCLEYLTYEDGDVISNPHLNFNINKQEDGILKVLFLDVSMKDCIIKSDGLVANLKFKVLSESDKSTSIKIENPTVGDCDVEPLYPKFVSGMVNISSSSAVTPVPENAFTVKIGSGNASVGDKITIPVSLSNVPSKGIISCNMTITYDSRKLEFIDYNMDEVVTTDPDTHFMMNKPHEGLLKLLFLDYTVGDEPITSDGTFVNLNFKVLNTYGDETSIYVTDSVFGDIDVNPVKAVTLPGVVDISRPLLPTSTPTPIQTNKLIVDVGSAEGKTGDVVRVPINLVNVPSIGIHIFYCRLSYDITKLMYLPNESSGSIKDIILDYTDPGRVTIAFTRIKFDNDDLIKKDCEIASIAFKIIGTSSESTPIKMENCDFMYSTDDDYNMGLIDTITNSGIVKIIGSSLPKYDITPSPSPSRIPSPTPTHKIADLEISVGSVKGKTGELVTVPVSFKNVPKGGILCADMAVNYDPSQLECVSIEAGNIVPNPETCFDKANTSKGVIKFLYSTDFTDSSYISSDGVFANITFKVLGSYDKSTKISVSNITAGDKYLLELPFRTSPGSVDISGTEPNTGFHVEIGSTKGYIGDLITIPVSISNIPANGIYALNMILDYDASKLECVDYEVGSIVPAPESNFAVNRETDGKVEILFVNYLLEHEYEINSDGVLVYLTFRVVSPGESTIYESKAKFLDGRIDELNALVIPGKISLSEPPLITEKVEVYSGAFIKRDNLPYVFEIDLVKVPSTGIKSFSMTVEYDPTKMKYIDPLSLTALYPEFAPEPRKDLSIQKISENSLKLIYEVSEENSILIRDYYFVNLFFDILTPSINDISIEIKDVAFTDRYGNPVGAEILSSPVTEFSIGNVEAFEGSTVVVPIKIDSVPQKGIDCSEVYIKYDTEALEYVGFEAGSLISDTSVCNIKENRYNKTITLLVDTHYNPIRTKGDLGYLTFKVKADSSVSSIEFDRIPTVLVPPYIRSRVYITNSGVSDEEPKGYTVSGCVYSNIGNSDLPDLSFSEGFIVELDGTAYSAVTDSNGYFEIKNVPNGKYKINITKTNYLSRYIENVSVDNDKVLSTAASPITLWCGDVEEDGKQDGAINLEDIMMICKAFNSVTGDGKYKENLDLNRDGAINLEDVMIVAKSFNRCSADYK